MKPQEFITSNVLQSLNEEKTTKTWYHGTADSREIERNGGFFDNTVTVDYVTDPNKLMDYQEQIRIASENGDNKEYHRVINLVFDLKNKFTYKKPLFLTDKYAVAKTYANPKIAFDYQNAVQKVYEVDVKCDKLVRIDATGDRFRFIPVEKVKRGFINAGVSEEQIDKLIAMFNYYVQGNTGIKTNVIAAIGSFLGFDCIDVIGVLDSYEGGKIKSTVRMVLNPLNVKIKNK